jgi:uncharacterized damage-inducible protein DinB
MTTPEKSKSLEASVSIAFINQATDFLTGEYLPKIERCVEQLTDEQIWWRSNAQCNSIGNLILHLCGNARQWIVCGLGSEPDTRIRDAEFAQRDALPRDYLVKLLRSTVGDVETVLRQLDPSTLLEKRTIQGSEVDVLHAIFHVTEHFSMHTGQIILLTKLLTATDLHFYDFEGDVPTQRFVPRSS